MKKLVAMALLLATLVAPPLVAEAQQQAYAAKNVHLRAGPGRDYPVVAILPAGFAITVLGCLSNYSWCDVHTGLYRGWIYAGNIHYPYHGIRVPVLDYGAQIGIAVLGFILFDYWTDHYRDRPFYRQREQWVHRPRPPQHVGPGPVRPQPPAQVSPPAPRPQPPAQVTPRAPRPQPPQPVSPGVQRPKPAQQQVGPGAQRAQPPQPVRPGVQQPPQQDSPGVRRPQPSQQPRPGG